MSMFKRLACALCAILFPALMFAPASPAQVGSCWYSPTPYELRDFESCTFTAPPCPTLQNLSSGGWHVSHGSPNGTSGNGSSTALNFVGNAGGSEGAYTCISLKPYTQYALRFDIASYNGATPARMYIKAADGLIAASSAPGQCQDPLPVPTYEQQIYTEDVNFYGWQSRQICFTTDENSYSQLWVHGEYIPSYYANTSFAIDNIEVIEMDFDLYLNGQAGSDIIICQGADDAQQQPLWLQYVPKNDLCNPEQYSLSIWEGPVMIKGKVLTGGELNALKKGTLNLRNVDFSGSFFTPETGKCYSALVIAFTDCGCDVIRDVSFCVDECECTFPELSIAPAIGEQGEWYFDLYPWPGSILGGNTVIGGAYWDFGDGTSGWGWSPVHVYPNGDYTVSVTVYAVNMQTGDCCDTTLYMDITQEYADFLTNPGRRDDDAYESERLLRTGPSDDTRVKKLQLLPNPVGEHSVLEINVPLGASGAEVRVYDSRGQLHSTLLQAPELSPGTHRLDVDANSLENGVYYIQFHHTEGAAAVQMVVGK